ncbi:MAG: glycine betaine/proline transport system substrate-binding protein [Ilumatobacteraceae bacterium]|jgi:glycine betaine/proline transport system substrate-binding protein
MGQSVGARESLYVNVLRVIGAKGENMRTRIRTSARFAIGAVALALVAAACGSDTKSSNATTPAAGTQGATGTVGTNPAAGGTTPTASAGAAIKLAANPWTGSAVNAAVAKVVLESKLGTPTEVVALDENAAWVGLDAGSLDANLEIWPSGHAADRKTYIDEKKSVVDLGKLGPSAKIGWYVPSFVIDQHPELKTWEGFKNPDLAKLFATAESGSQGQFLMGDPSYVTYDEQIIKNLNLPLKFVVAGSEAALITAIQQAETDQKPLLLQFWQPHWLQSKVKLTEVKLPAVSDACKASLAAADGKYACDYPVDELYKAANAGLEAKNKVAFDFLKKFTLTTDQQNEIAAMVDSDGKTADVAAKTWVDANPDIVKAWLG